MYRHFIFTRWNLLIGEASVYNNPLIKNSDEWMQHRINLFEKYTLPSVLNQTCKNFKWLLSFDVSTPDEITDRYRGYPFIQIIHQYPADYVRSLYPEKLKDGDWLITSRLDNDDMIEPTYIAKIQEQYHNDSMEDFLIVDADGRQLELSTGRYYDTARKTNNSPFMSFIERVGKEYISFNKTIITMPVKTVFYCSHTNMILHFSSMRINERLYTMIIHDRNITNKIVGELL